MSSSLATDVQLSIERSFFIEEMAKEGMEGMDPLMMAACFALADEALAQGAHDYGLACGFSEETVTEDEVAQLKRDALGSKMSLEKVLSVQEEETSLDEICGGYGSNMHLYDPFSSDNEESDDEESDDEESDRKESNDGEECKEKEPERKKLKDEDSDDDKEDFNEEEKNDVIVQGKEKVAQLKRDALTPKLSLEKVLSVQEEEKAGETPEQASLDEICGGYGSSMEIYDPFQSKHEDSLKEDDEMVPRSPTPPDDASRHLDGGAGKGDGTLTGHLVKEAFIYRDTSPSPKPLLIIKRSKKAASFFRSSRVSPDRSKEPDGSYTKQPRRKRKASDIFRHLSTIIASPFRRFLRPSRQPSHTQ